jgi:ubiquinone biosynthesis protein
VAVKVLRPGVRPVIETDLALLGFLSSAVAFVVPSVKYFDFDTALNQFSAEVRSQLDLQVEAMHLSTFAKMFAGDAEIRVPMPIASTRDVLVMPEVQGFERKGKRAFIF